MTNILSLLNRCSLPEECVLQPGYDSFDFESLFAGGYIFSNGFADYVFCCEDGGDVEIEWLKDPNGEMVPWRCCPICGAKKIDPKELQTWKVNFPMLLERVSQSLGLEIPREEIPSVLYYLGTKSGSPIYYLRSIDGSWRRNVEKIVNKPTAVILLVRERQRYFYAEEYDKPTLLLEDFGLEYHGGKIVADRPAFEAELVNLGLIRDSSQPQYRFVRRAGWYIKYGLTETFLPGDLIGLEYIQQLLKYPGKEVSVTKFFQEMSGQAYPVHADEGEERLDDEAIKTCRKRLEEIKREREEAKENRDRPTYDALGKEAAYLKRTLKSNAEYFGKKQKMGDELKALRRRVSDRIKAALEKIAESDPLLTAHLDCSIERGVTLVYKPEKNVPWSFV